MNFFVFALPRSRTAWLSHFLSRPGQLCGHDEIIDCRTILDYFNKFSPQGYLTGSCETATMLGWKIIKQQFPRAKLVVVNRPLMQVAAELVQFGFEPSLWELEERRIALEAISNLPDTLTVDFRQLAEQKVCEAVYSHCCKEQCPSRHWERFADVNIQVDMVRRIAKLQFYAPMTVELKLEVSQANRRMSTGQGLETNV